MNGLKRVTLALVMLGTLAAGAVGLAGGGLGEPTGDQEVLARLHLAAIEKEQQNGGPEASYTTDIRGQWEVLYVAGTVTGQREGHSMPNLIVPATDKTIKLPTLSGKPKDPLNFLGAMPYKLDPGLKEIEGRAESAERGLEVSRIYVHRTDRAVRQEIVPQGHLLVAKADYAAAKKRLDEAETAWQEAEKRRDERKAGKNADESWIDMEADPAMGGKVVRGIYQLKNNILTICYADADQERPETFADLKPSEHLIILRRILPVSPFIPGRPQPKPTPPDIGKSR